MEFKKLKFEDSNAQKIYENYLKQIQVATKKLAAEDQMDILAELNSHIYESTKQTSTGTSEVTNLLTTLDSIGVPNEVLQPLVAQKKLNQATKSFNPVHIFQALILNMSYGIVYFVFFLFYLLLGSFFVLIFAKIGYPNSIGLYYKRGEIFQYGAGRTNESLQEYEILGNWFIPFTLLLGIVFYLLITLLLKLVRTLKDKKNKNRKIGNLY